MTIRQRILLFHRMIEALKRAYVYVKVLESVYTELGDSDDELNEINAYLHELDDIQRNVKGFR